MTVPAGFARPVAAGTRSAVGDQEGIAMRWYYISYNFTSPAGAGYGDFELQMDDLPRRDNADLPAIVAAIRKDSPALADATIHVVAWSPLRD